MVKTILFFHGGDSDEDYAADAQIVEALKLELGPGYSIRYPRLPDNGTPDFGRRQQISHEISMSEDNVILIGHSLGASMLLACLSEMQIDKKIAGIFLLATPFWSGREDWVQPLKLQPNFATQLDTNTPLYFYHCGDDEEVPFRHLTIYMEQVPWASFRELATGGHQFDNNLAMVAEDIKSIAIWAARESRTFHIDR